MVLSMGQSYRVYEVLKRKRGLTAAMTFSLHQNLGTPVESRIGP